MRSFRQKNAVGGFIGGFVGLLLIGWAGLVVGLVGCAIGFLMGFYHEPVGANARHAWVSTSATTRTRGQRARAIVWRGRLWIYLTVIASLFVFSAEFWIGSREGARTWVVSMAMMVKPLMLTLVITIFGLAVSVPRSTKKPRFDSSTFFEDIDDWMLSVFVLIVFIGIPYLMSQSRRFTHYFGRLRKEPALQVPWALAIARSVYCAVWVMTTGATFITFPNSTGPSYLLSILSVVAAWMGVMISMDNRSVVPEIHRADVRRRRIEALASQGFLRYTLHFTVRMFSVFFAFAFTVCWCLALSGTLLLFWGTGLALPIYFVYFFVRGLRRVSDGTHWVGMITTLTVTVYTAFLLNDHLAGYALLIAAFACGAISGLASVLATEALSVLFKRLAPIKRFIEAKPADIWTGMGRWKPSDRTLQWIIDHNPLEKWMDRISSEHNFGL